MGSIFGSKKKGFFGSKGRPFAHRKANTILDVATGIVIILVLFISVIFGKYIITEINTEIGNDESISNETKAVIDAWDQRYVGFWDGLFLFILVMVWALLIVSVVMIDSHPIFFFFVLVGCVFVFIFGAYLSNAYSDIMADETISSVAEEFTVTHWVLGHLLHVAILMAGSGLIAAFVKQRYLG